MLQLHIVDRCPFFQDGGIKPLELPEKAWESSPAGPALGQACCPTALFSKGKVKSPAVTVERPQLVDMAFSITVGGKPEAVACHAPFADVPAILEEIGSLNG